MSARRPLPARLLALGAAAALALSLGAPVPARAAPPAAGPARVVLVVLGGGVRAKEALGRPDLLPTLAAVGKAGFSSPGWAVAGTDHDAAVEGLLTGRRVAADRGGRARAGAPTLLEEARRAGLSAEDVWYVSFLGGDALSLATSEPGPAGPLPAPSLAGGEGPFEGALGEVFRRFGRPDPTEPRTWARLERLRAATARAAGPSPAGAAGDAREDLRLERALLEDVDRRTASVGGAGALDARAVRAAITVLRVHRPRLLVVRLGQADVGHGGVAAYEDVLRRDDAELARLRAEVAGDPALAATTSLLVTSELGRDAAPNARGGLDHGDGSPDVLRVAVVGEGPAWRRGATPRAPLDLRDLAPTIARALGFAMPSAEGTPREDLLAPPRR